MSTVPRRLGKYELQELLGQGGMAEVWKAYDTQLRRYVAIKLLHANLQADPDFITRFAREAQVVAALRHPNIVQIYDFYISESNEPDQTQGSTVAYMVMEYIQGRTLADYIRDTSAKREFPVPAAIVRLFTPISLALDYAHRQGMIHRDIKPANILLDQTNTARNPMGEPVLSDFGIAKVVGAAGQTMTGSLLGTPLYISPEQVQGHTLTNRSDLYSLAVVLYQMVTGVTPFQSDTITAIMMKHLTETPAAPHLINPNLPPALSAVLLKALAKDPQQRYPGASAMTAAVARAFNLPVPPELAPAVAAMEGGTIPSNEMSRFGSQPGVSSAPALSEMETIRPSRGTPNPVTPFLGETPASNASDQSPVLPPFMSESAATIAASPAVSTPVPATARSAPPAGSPPAPTPAPPVPPAPRNRQGVRAVLIALVVVVLLGSGLGAFLLASRHPTNTPASTPTTTGVAPTSYGQVYFFSSNQVNDTTNQGINDEFQVNLHTIPDPPSGKTYYAWLSPDVSAGDSGVYVLLGALTVNNGTISFTYKGDGQHTNLLAITSGFLITEETSGVSPISPTPDHTAWKYFARLPQTPAAGQKYNLLDHLRHLLSNDPELMSFQLYGGLNIWAYRNTLKINGYAQNMQNNWHSQNVSDLRHRLIETLDLLDGAQYVANDVPAGTSVQAPSAQVGLLTYSVGQATPAYLEHIATHLEGVLNSPGSTVYQRRLATQIDTTLSNVRALLQKVRGDAIQLLHMSDSQLLQQSSLSTINDLSTNVTLAFKGGNGNKGVSQMYVDVQRLATYDVTAYTGH